MIRIAICDDDKDMASQIEAMAGSYFESVHEYVKTELFLYSSTFFDEINDGEKYNIILLDIEMPGLDGMVLAEKIRRELPDCILIFISSHEKYVYDVFRYHAFRFIPKSQISERLPIAFADALRELNGEDGKHYNLEHGKSLLSIPCQRILYIDRDGKNAVFHLSGMEEQSVRKTLKQVFEELPNEDFIWIDKMICGLSQISRIEGDIVILADGTRLRVARGRITEVKDRLRAYWTRRS